MSQLIVITFETEGEAAQVREDLKQLERSGGIGISDAAVIHKDANGKAHVNNEVSDTTKWGAVGGSILGVFLMFLFPLAGLALGAAGGAAVGALMGRGVDRKFVKDVTEGLKPGGSALFIIMEGSYSSALTNALEPYKATLYQTTLDTDAEESLRRALK